MILLDLWAKTFSCTFDLFRQYRGNSELLSAALEKRKCSAAIQLAGR